MITDAIFDAVGGVSTLLVGLLPVGALLTGLTIPSGWLWGYDVINAYLPVSEILIAASVLVGARITMIGVKAMVFVYKLIPFV